MRSAVNLRARSWISRWSSVRSNWLVIVFPVGCWDGKRAPIGIAMVIDPRRQRRHHAAAMTERRSSTPRRPLLPHRRNDEGVGAVADAAIGPALGDRLDLGPEFDAFHAVLVGVAECR